MQLVIDIPDNEYHQICELRLHNRTFYDDAIRKGIPLNDVLDKIRAEIEKPLHDERCFDTANAKAQYIALNWCIEIIDKYRK